jgi:hypothetical protein
MCGMLSLSTLQIKEAQWIWNAPATVPSGPDQQRPWLDQGASTPYCSFCTLRSSYKAQVRGQGRWANTGKEWFYGQYRDCHAQVHVVQGCRNDRTVICLVHKQGLGWC